MASVLESIEKLKQTRGIHGMHIMAVHWEEIVPRLIAESGVPKPAIRAWGEVGRWSRRRGLCGMGWVIAVRPLLGYNWGGHWLSSTAVAVPGDVE